VLNGQLIALTQKNGVAVFSPDSFRTYRKNADGKSVDSTATTSRGKQREADRPAPRRQDLQLRRESWKPLPAEVLGSTVAFWTQFFYPSEFAEDDP